MSAQQNFMLNNCGRDKERPKEKILVVDDSYDICKLLQNILKMSGYQVLMAENGKEGLLMIQEQAPDMIILDNHMPIMNGITMLAALRDFNNHTPVIFMTAYGSEQIAIEAFRLGINNYLIKPFSLDEVQTAVDWALRETRLLREKEQLDRDLLAAETVQRTMVTLAHHINNQLMVVNSGFTLISETLNQQLNLEEEMKPKQIVYECQKSLRNISAVLRVLQKVSHIQLVEYYDQIKMLNIDEALALELEQSKYLDEHISTLH